MILIQPKSVVIDGQKFILSKFPATVGREIITQYPISAIPKLGDYKRNEELMFKLMAFVGKKLEGREEPMMLGNQALIDNHISTEFPGDTLLKIEAQMIEYNSGFFQIGRLSTFFGSIAQKLPQWISKILTDSLVSLSQMEKPPSTN